MYTMDESGRGASIKSPLFTLTSLEIPRLIEILYEESIFAQELLTDRNGNAVIEMICAGKKGSAGKLYFIIQHAREVMLKDAEGKKE